MATRAEQERDALRAEVNMLRGVGCDELDGTDVRGPCGACLKCARRERDREHAARVAAEAEADGLRRDLAAAGKARDEAVADAKRLREREEHFASALSVADGGQYRNDWDGAIRRVIAERDLYRAALASATTGDALRCDTCHGGILATVIHADCVAACDGCAKGDGWIDTPHAAAIRGALKATEGER